MRPISLLCVSILTMACADSQTSPRLGSGPISPEPFTPAPVIDARTLRIVDVGQTVTDLNVFAIAPKAFFRLTAPSDGMLVVHVTWKWNDPSDDGWYGLGYYSGIPTSYSERNDERVMRVRVVAGRTYDFSVDTCCFWDWGDGPPFVWTTWME